MATILVFLRWWCFSFYLGLWWPAYSIASQPLLQILNIFIKSAYIGYCRSTLFLFYWVPCVRQDGYRGYLGDRKPM